MFAPGQDMPGRFNLWKGFAVAPQQGDWSLLHDRIVENICRGALDVAVWVMAWLAAAVQQPGEPAEVALVMRGARGVGKSLFARLFGRLFGPHFIHVSSPRLLTGNFNSHLRDAVVVFADEAFVTGDRATEGVLKTIITEPTIVIEPKHRDAFAAKNVIHLITASNADWVVPAGMDERRFCVLDVGDGHAQNQAYFAESFNRWRTAGWRQCCSTSNNLTIRQSISGSHQTLRARGPKNSLDAAPREVVVRQADARLPIGGGLRLGIGSAAEPTPLGLRAQSSSA